MFEARTHRRSVASLAVVEPVASPLAPVTTVAPAKLLPGITKTRPTREQKAIVRETLRRGTAQEAHRLLGERALQLLGELHDDAHQQFVSTAHTIRTRQQRYADSPAAQDIAEYTDEAMAMYRRHSHGVVEGAGYQIAAAAAQPFEYKDEGLLTRAKKKLL